jgi:phage host-nuclease inhibitor protein Gam
MAADAAKEVDGLLESIGKIVSELEAEENKLNKRIKEVQDEFGSKIDELVERRDDLVQKLAKLANEHRKTLVQPGTKMISLRHGQLRWRRSRRALKVEGDEDAILRWLKRNGKLRTFTRIGKRTIDKTKLKAAPGLVAKIPGLRITQTEDLVIKPDKAQAEIVRTGNPLKVPVPEGED